MLGLNGHLITNFNHKGFLLVGISCPEADDIASTFAIMHQVLLLISNFANVALMHGNSGFIYNTLYTSHLNDNVKVNMNTMRMINGFHVDVIC